MSVLSLLALKHPVTRLSAFFNHHFTGKRELVTLYFIYRFVYFALLLIFCVFLGKTMICDSIPFNCTYRFSDNKREQMSNVNHGPHPLPLQIVVVSVFLSILTDRGYLLKNDCVTYM